MNYKIGNSVPKKERHIAKKALIILGICITWLIMVVFFVGVLIQFMKELTRR